MFGDVIVSCFQQSEFICSEQDLASPHTARGYPSCRSDRFGSQESLSSNLMILSRPTVRKLCLPRCILARRAAAPSATQSAAHQHRSLHQPSQQHCSPARRAKGPPAAPQLCPQRKSPVCRAEVPSYSTATQVLPIPPLPPPPPPARAVAVATAVAVPARAVAADSGPGGEGEGCV